VLTALLDKFIVRFPRTGRPLLWLRKHRKTRRTLFIASCHLLGALTSIHAIPRRTHIAGCDCVGSVAEHVSVRRGAGVLGVRAVKLRGLRRVAAQGEDRNERGRAAARARSPGDASGAGVRAGECDAAGKTREAPGDARQSHGAADRRRGDVPGIFESIEQAREYVLVQSYIIHDDGLGRRLKDALIAKARAGVRCYVLYDEIGSHDLPAAYISDLRAAGVDIRKFNTRQGDANRFQLNFRNHRKVVICRWPHRIRWRA
jgi:cardiolipin synthase